MTIPILNYPDNNTSNSLFFFPSSSNDLKLLYKLLHSGKMLTCSKDIKSPLKSPEARDWARISGSSIPFFNSKATTSPRSCSRLVISSVTLSLGVLNRLERKTDFNYCSKIKCGKTVPMPKMHKRFFKVYETRPMVSLVLKFKTRVKRKKNNVQTIQAQ